MLTSLRIRNFQSLADVELELGHLSVIVGATNSGKSAVVRALESLFFNRSGNEFIRSGQNECTIDVELDGRRLRWIKRGGAGGVYELDGEVISRALKELPPELLGLIGVREIEGEGFRARVQVDGQFSPPFLLAGTGGQAARLLAKVSKLDVLVTAQVLARRDRERTHRAGAEAASQASELAERLAAQPDYEALLMRWRLLCSEWNIVEEKRRRLEVASVQIVRLRGLQAMKARWNQARLPELAAALSTPESLGRMAQAVQHHLAVRGRLDRAAADVAAATDRMSALENELHGALAELEICPVCQRPMRK